MPTTLPERSKPEHLPPRRLIVAIGIALVVLIGLIASRAPVLAWVRDVGQPVLLVHRRHVKSRQISAGERSCVRGSVGWAPRDWRPKGDR